MTVTANIKPVPAFVARISNADIAHGEKVGAFNVWPIARPVVTVERGERLAVTLRIRPAEPTSGNLKLANASEAYKLRREANGDGYLLDMAIEPSNDLTQRVMPVALQINDGASGELALQLTVNVQAENLVATPRQLDLGEVSLANLQNGATAGTRVRSQKDCRHISHQVAYINAGLFESGAAHDYRRKQLRDSREHRSDQTSKSGNLHGSFENRNGRPSNAASRSAYQGDREAVNNRRSI